MDPAGQGDDGGALGGVPGLHAGPCPHPERPGGQPPDAAGTRRKAIAPEELARIAVPTTLIWGRYDRVMRLPPSGPAPATAAHVIEDAGHFAVEQPEAFRRALRAALGTPEAVMGVVINDAAVVGAGRPGWPPVPPLTDRGVEHVVLGSRTEVAPGTWAQRWDLPANTAGWMNAMLGGQARDAYATGQGVVRRLERLADNRPSREGVRVTRLAPTGSAWAVATDDGELRARTVVVATGDQGQARVGPAGFRGGRLPPRPTGPPASSPTGRCWWSSAQSGCQIAEDLRAGGRRVILATSTAGRVPFRHRDREVPRVAGRGRLHGPAARRPARPVGHGRHHADHRSGAWPEPAGRWRARRSPRPGARCRWRGAGAVRRQRGRQRRRRGRLRHPRQVDDRRAHPPPGLEAPPAEPDEHDAMSTLDRLPPDPARRGGRGAQVVWCTGFTGDFSWLDPALVGADGQPRHHDGAPALASGTWGCAGCAAKPSCSASPATLPGWPGRSRSTLGG